MSYGFINLDENLYIAGVFEIINLDRSRSFQTRPRGSQLAARIMDYLIKLTRNRQIINWPRHICTHFRIDKLREIK